MNCEGNERNRVNQLADIFFHWCRRLLLPALQSNRAVPTGKSIGNVDIPQEAFIEVLKAKRAHALRMRSASRAE